MGFRVNSAKSSQKKQKKNEPRHRRKKPQHINPSRRVVQSSRAWAARGGMFTFFSTTEGNTTPGRKKSKALKQLTVWVFCMFHQVSARCLRRQSSVSTAVFFGCLCVRFFPLLSCHGEGGREGGICKLEMWFLFFSFFLIWNQERKKKAYEGELSLVMKPRYPWQVATRPLTAEDGSRGSEHTGSLRPHVFTCASVCFSGMMSGGDHSIPSSRCAFIYYFYSFPSDWRGCVRCVRGKKSEVCCWIQGRPGWEISLLENMVALDW